MLLVDKQTVFDEQKVRQIAQKVQDQGFTPDDLLEGVAVLGMLCNHSAQMRFELRGYTKSFQFEIGDAVCAIVFEHGTCACYRGPVHLPNVTFGIKPERAMEILNKQVHSAVAHMNGDVAVKGIKNDALRFQDIFELFLSELDDFA